MTKFEVFTKIYFSVFFAPTLGILTAFLPIYSYYGNFFGSYSFIDFLDGIYGGLLISHLIIIILSLLAIFYGIYLLYDYSEFPSVKEAKIFYREKRRIKRAENQLNKKKRFETAKEEYKKKMELLEEEKKKYL